MRKGLIAGFIGVFICSSPCFSKTAVKFVYDPEGKNVNKVAVAGSFNSWNADANILEKRSDGKYATEIQLNEGVHYYKFVIDGNNWIADPSADESLKKSDGYGGYNSGVYAGEKGAQFGSAEPNHINTSALKYEINVISPRLVEIKLRTLAGDVSLAAVNFPENKIILAKTVTSAGFDYYSNIAEIKNPEKGYFEISDGNETVIFPEKRNIKFELKPEFPVPVWAEGCIWYQIMAERFANGEKANDPDNTLPWSWDFGKAYGTEKGNFYNFVWGRFFGGDLQGLIEKLPHLKGIGVEAIYLNPVFEAASYQKYDASDFRHIDQDFGYKTDYAVLGETEDPKTWKWTETDKLFLEFLKKAHSMDMKVIIDGVFNHSGDHHWAFTDLKQKNEDSKYKEWYIVTDWAVFKKSSNLGKGYAGWAGFGGLPEFSEDENGLVAPVKKHIFDITKRWMDPDGDGDPSDGIDGWRLDVPDCVKIPFWKEWCSLVRKINADAYIVGELWGESPDWLTRELFHAQMNYPLVKLMIKFFIDKSLTASQFDKSLNELLALYPMQVNLVQMNLLDSHDTDRIASMIYNPNREYDKRNRINPSDTGDYNKDYKNTKPAEKEYHLLKQLVNFQFTFIGSPCIWYGDEAGMWGADDPFDRKPMLWKEIKYDEEGAAVNEDVLSHYKKLAGIRRTHPVFKTGVFKSLLAADDRKVYAFLRQKGENLGIAVFNNSQETQKVILDVPAVTAGGQFKDVLNNKKYEVKNNKITLEIAPNWSGILVN